jgi:hypothetical protein
MLRLTKADVVEMLKDPKFNLSATFVFNQDAGAENFKVEKALDLIKHFNTRFFRAHYGPKWYREPRITSLHVPEHRESNLHMHSVYKWLTSDKAGLEVLKPHMVEALETRANEVFREKVWAKGTIKLSVISDEHWADYMAKAIPSNRALDPDQDYYYPL